MKITLSHGSPALKPYQISSFFFFFKSTGKCYIRLKAIVWIYNKCIDEELRTINEP